MQRFRPLIFLLFVAFFFITAALVLFYTFGYRFSPERGVFVYTGSITVDSNPQSVSISLDGVNVPENRLGILNSSAHIPGLPPGEHFVEVTAPGYTTWQKKAVVESGRSTEFWNVLLTPQNPEHITLPGTASAIKAYPSPDRNILAIVKKHAGELTLDVYDTSKLSGEQVFSLPNGELLPDRDDGIEWSSDGERILIPLLENGERRYFVVDVGTKASFELPRLTKDNQRKYARWHPRDRNILFYLNEEKLYQFDVSQPEGEAALVRENIETYDISSQYLYVLNASNGIVSRLPISAKPDTSATQVTTAPIALASDGSYSLVVYDDTRLVILESTLGAFWLYNNLGNAASISPMREVLPSGVRGTQFSDDGKKVLYYTDTEISVVFLREWEVQPVREADSTFQIVRFSQPLQFAQWTKDYEHVLFALGGSVKVAELDNRDRRNILDLINFEKPPLQILSQFQDNALYFAEEKPEGQDVLMYIQFPEPTGFLGFGQ
ncbi:MAG: hypothetical protein A2808_01205 [Candidatus Moranbacteria bacterium RIFCSPHIGHO2_01_FULL_55_24]|nr:MAG: hypothetical protein A2808_01205 [Candidatus Moranbacteria bacterium RIFCSPHIGHO2_01_FULL_55_24]